MHDHKHCVLLDFALVDEHIILVVFVGGEHAFGKELLKVYVEIVPLLALVFFGSLHGAFKAEIFHFQRLFGYDLHESHIFKIAVSGQYFALGHVKPCAQFGNGIVFCGIGAKIQTVKIDLDLLFVAIRQMLVDEQVVHERKRFHQKVA